ncbi:acyl-CoA dehydratase activase [Ruminococcus difficilis]|uniref:2-hydroxyacyl-CoA dehydratase n=1 Tax=Ruminococcus difficilis TaxID=2763069 RepID=A0A934TZY0_9FIRM|nr:acyl-CoA dehydratase activase [Ruminococcus difficilis]MBK6087910.1 2-hydroxyacyl-CoA dehydratase [Ruminococcus difficilis]
MRLGLDIGSTTIKCVVLDEDNKLIYSTYERHYSQITDKIAELLDRVRREIDGADKALVALSGSAGMGVAQDCGIDFVQEVYATRVAANTFIPGTDVVIELGGEDAKILFLTNGLEVRMNGTCAGGTGAFIDQMATLLNVPLEEMDDLAKQYEKTYTIASRCGVFAKTDIQPLLNQGARKSDIAESIFNAVVSQTVAGLAQGREIEGQIVYLGGPLTFMSELRNCFDRTLGTKGICPENSLYYVACGAALCAEQPIDFDAVIEAVKNYHGSGNFAFNQPLFISKGEYESFCLRHSKADVKQKELKGYKGRAYIGMDAGSTTVKGVVLNSDGEMLYSKYLPSKGNPVEIIKAFLEEVYAINPDLDVASSAVTGYGEDIIRNAFDVDYGIVETIAHFTAAKYFMPDVEFIIDIGGQDIKCFKIHNGAIDNIFLNEACSSGCGSFLQTFANALGYGIEEFSKLGLFAKRPVDLGSRCTVFMNSSVKQAQKDGATIEDISAGLSLSVVKNALYKVIRASSPDELGKKIVVQGGTFLNDAVLRAFEMEMGVEVVRPNIAGLMGAYGAALYSMKKSKGSGKSSLSDSKALQNFVHEIKVTNCGLCNNNCRLTINSFGGGRKFIAGNRCERPITKKAPATGMNMYEYKLRLLETYRPVEGIRGKLGIPMGLNMFELYPFWYRFFTELKFEVVHSQFSNRKLYQRGQQTIPSDTVCFPAKLMHGHVQTLIDEGIETIFYPCLSYNFDEHLGDNHYNCPVVAYYPEVIRNNMKDVKKVNFIKEYFGIHRPKDFPKKAYERLSFYFPDITLNEVRVAAKKAYEEQERYRAKVQAKGDEIIRKAEHDGKKIFVLAGRPYHIDPEINHGIDKLIAGFDVAIVSEDVVSSRVDRFHTGVLNQWTYHSRLYAAAKYVTTRRDMELVQLVSFGCGVDAITTDEVREILEEKNKIYTQIKIDEITNLGAVKIRIRSLLAAIDND